MYNVKGDLLVKRDLVVNNRNSSLLAVNIPNWQTAKAYLIGDTVYSSNILYKAIANHTSGTFSTDLAANQWIIVTPNTATSITNTPAGNIAATTVQAAITELDNEKQAKIAFYEEGTIIGTLGQYTKVNFLGGTVTAAQNGSDATQLDVTITSSSGGSTLGRTQLAGTGTATGTKLDVKYDILSGTPVLSYTIASGIGTLSVSGGTVNYRKIQAGINTSTDVDGSGFFTLVVNNLPTSTMFEYPFAQLIDTKAGVSPSTTAYQYRNSGSAPIMNITSATAGSSITLKTQSEIVTTFGASAKAVSMIVLFG